MSGGQYKVWAQAVGFETSKAEADLSAGAKKQVDLTLASLSDFHKQLSGTEWAAEFAGGYSRRPANEDGVHQQLQRMPSGQLSIAEPV